MSRMQARGAVHVDEDFGAELHRDLIHLEALLIWLRWGAIAITSGAWLIEGLTKGTPWIAAFWVTTFLPVCVYNLLLHLALLRGRLSHSTTVFRFLDAAALGWLAIGTQVLTDLPSLEILYLLPITVAGLYMRPIRFAALLLTSGVLIYLLRLWIGDSTGVAATVALGFAAIFILVGTLVLWSKNVMLRRHREMLTDRLTGLPNHGYFTRTLIQKTRYAQERREPLSLILFDLDRFKEVNDQYGHTAGDRVLAHVGEILSEAEEKGFFPARYGGEEFAVILPNVDSEAAREYAEHVRKRLALSPVAVAAGKSLNLTASFGVATQYGEEAHPQALVRQADAALYASKAEGGDAVSMGDDLKMCPELRGPAAQPGRRSSEGLLGRILRAGLSGAESVERTDTKQIENVASLARLPLFFVLTALHLAPGVELGVGFVLGCLPYMVLGGVAAALPARRLPAALPWLRFADAMAVGLLLWQAHMFWGRLEASTVLGAVLFHAALSGGVAAVWPAGAGAAAALAAQGVWFKAVLQHPTAAILVDAMLAVAIMFILAFLGFFLAGVTNRASRRSFRDPLTWLQNQYYLRLRLRHLWNEEQPAPAALIMIDLDEFKSINDTFGHPAGDAALRSVADLIRELTPDQAVRVRYGGDELAVLLSGDHAQHGPAIAEAICNRLERLDVHVDGRPISLRGSAGVAMRRGSGETDYDFLERADKALQRAKRKGKSRVEVDWGAAQPERQSADQTDSGGDSFISGKEPV